MSKRRSRGRKGARPHGRILSYYREFLAQSDDARKVAWRTRFDQELRYENLLEAVDDPSGELSVLDVGCGLGDLFAYLRATGRGGDYLGVDIVPEMVERARDRHPAGRFEALDILGEDPGRFDLVVCSGGLTVRTSDHLVFVHQMLRRMFELAEEAVAVNFQSTRAFEVNPFARENPDIFHADPLELYRFCRGLSRWTALREDTLPTDFTVYLYKKHARSIARYARKAAPAPTPWGLAYLLLERRLPEAALDVLEAAEPTAEHLNLIGVAHRQMGHPAQAEAAFRAALEADPEYGPARQNLE